MAETQIRVASEVQQAAADLIDTHHEHLQEARILWLFTTANRTRGNRVTLGSAARSTVLVKFLSQRKDGEPADFIVQIDEKRWATMLATQRAAFVDSMLCRMQRREVVNQRSGKVTQTWITVEPDVQEFTDVIVRHGVWLPTHQRFAKAIQQHGSKQLTLKLRDVQGEIEADEPVRSSGTEPERRTTTVEGDGTVVTTELQPSDADALHDRAPWSAESEHMPPESHGATAAADDGKCATCGGDHTADDHDMVTAMEQRQAARRGGTETAPAPLLEVAEQAATPDGVDNATAASGNWRERSGVEQGELAEQRRRRTSRA